MASSLRDGATVLGIHAGKLGLVRLASVKPIDSQRSPPVWVCTDAGDLILGAESQLATSGGLRTAGDLLALRDGTSIGRMSGEWPSIEAYGGGKEPRAGIRLSSVLEQLRASAAVKGAGFEIIRVGSLSTGALVETGSLLVSGRCEMEPGPVGWSWVRRASDKRSVVPTPTAEGVHRVLLSLWQASPNDQVVKLPMELRALRWLSLVVLSELGRPYTLDYRPRYWPLEVELSPVAEPQPHAAVQVVLPVNVEGLIELETATSGSYIIANNLLCAA